MATLLSLSKKKKKRKRFKKKKKKKKKEKKLKKKKKRKEKGNRVPNVPKGNRQLLATDRLGQWRAGEIRKKKKKK